MNFVKISYGFMWYKYKCDPYTENFLGKLGATLYYKIDAIVTLCSIHC